MPTPLLIGAASGLVSAALFGSAATATAIAGILLYLAPLPLCLAGLGWGSAAAAAGVMSGTLAVALLLGLPTAAVFAFSIGIPIAALCYLILLSRAPVTAEGASAGPVEWYPIGRLIGWAAVIAGTLAAVVVLFLGYDQETYRESIKAALEHSALKELDRDGILTEENIANLTIVLARALPAAIAAIWLCIALFNLWMGGLIVQASGRALRPWPQLDAIDLPNVFFIVFAVSLVLSFIPGLIGLVATGFAGAMLFAFVLQGLAVLHVYTRGVPFRGLLLTAIYLGIFLLGWVALAVAILGLSEPMLRLRERAAGRGQPPAND